MCSANRQQWRGGPSSGGSHAVWLAQTLARDWRRDRRRVAVLLAALGLLAMATVAPVAAESPPHRVILSYVPVTSNWGPTDANGVALISYPEGDVRADLIGLPVLDDAQRYQMWLMNTASGERFALTRFNASPPGQVTYVDETLPAAIPEEGWDLVAITVEPEPDPDPAPSEQYAIVGSIPGTPAEIRQLPPELPQTGIASMVASRPALTLLVANGATVAALVAWRRRWAQTRRTHAGRGRR